MKDFFILQQTHVPVFQRFDEAFAEFWKQSRVPIRLLVERTIPLDLLRRPECRGLAGGQLYQFTIPREALQGKWVINASQRFREDHRGLNVFVDNQEVGKLAVEHLMDRGYTSLVVVEEGAHRFSRVRSDAFCQYAGLKGLQVCRHSVHFVFEKHGYENEEILMRSLGFFIKQQTVPCGIFCVNDVIAENVLRVFYDIPPALRLPHAVIGVDDLYEEPLELLTCPVPLSSIRPPFEEAGRVAAKRVVEACSTGAALFGTEIISGARLMVRESSSGTAPHDALVLKATRRVHAMLKEGEVPKVTALAKTCMVSERTLYNRFQAALKMSPQAYILNERLSQVCILLRYTTRPITDIALELGFSPANTLPRQFRKRFGMSPRDFRKQYA